MAKLKKLILILFTILAVMISSISCTDAAAGTQEVTVYLDNNQIIFDTEPEIVNGRTMVPLRAIFEALNMNVSWDGSTQKVTATKDGLEIVLYIGSDTPTVNGETVVIDSKAYIVNGRTMVPLRFIAESTGANVEWKSVTRSVLITSDNGQDVVDMSDELVLTYKIVDTGQETLFTNTTTQTYIAEGSSFYGQDAHYDGYQPSYIDNGDGTVTDNVTGLMWQQTMDEKMTFEEAFEYAENCTLGGYDDWRIPNIKELFSLMMYSGSSSGIAADELYIDTDYFDQPIGDTSIGEREIDAQVLSSTVYTGTTMKGDTTVFGVNFVDGRIKGYGIEDPRTGDATTKYFRLVRGNEDYGENNLIDNGDGTITDLATGLMWQKADDGESRDWEDALKYAEELELAGYDDWRLPNGKELQSIVDYSRSPQATDSAAIDPLFELTEITDPSGDSNYGFYWSSSTHMDGRNYADSAAYVAFGEAQGQMFGDDVIDVHGAGAVRSDPKSGNASDYPQYFGPQGDVQYVYNYVLAVRTVDEEELMLVVQGASLNSIN